MGATNRIRTQQLLREAEGYLELELPDRALELLGRITEPGSSRGRMLYLTGDALRALERYPEAIEFLESAADLSPSDIHIWIALGWCRKRTGRLDLAIEALEHAEEVEPGEAIVHYNLACYWSLAGNKDRALEYLTRALNIDPDYRDLVGAESDFDALRDDPSFQALTSLKVRG